jgi:hypothetical protein
MLLVYMDYAMILHNSRTSMLLVYMDYAMILHNSRIAPLSSAIIYPERGVAMPTIDDKIKALRDKLQKAEEQKRALEAKRKAADSKKTRSLDTRKKILAGSTIIDLMGTDEAVRSKMHERLNSLLTRSQDRELFGLGSISQG